MITKTITFTDFNGKTRTEDYYFHINKFEITKFDLEYREYGGLKGLIEKISKSEDIMATFDIFTKFITMSYGIKTADGISFHKDEAQTKLFMESEAFVILFEELASNPEEFAKFLQGIIPTAPEGSAAPPAVVINK